MAYQAPLNGGRINASIAGNATGGALVSTGTMQLYGGNNISLSQAGQTITISGPNAAAQTNQTLALSVASGSFGTASSTRDARSLTMVGTGAASVGFSTNGFLYISSPVQSSFSLSNANGITFNTNGSTVSASVNTSYAASNHSHGNPTLNLTNLSGTTASASNGLTLSLSAGAQSNPNISLYGLGNTTQNSSTVLNASNLSFNGLGGATVGYSNGSIQISGAQTVAQSNQNVSLYALGNTTQNSSTVLNASNLSFNGLGAATMGYSNGSIQVSVPTQTVQTQNLMTVNGTQGAVSISGGANVTVGNNASTITISAAAQTNQSLGIVATGANTIGQSSSNTLDARSVNISGQGALSAGMSGSTLQLSVPAQTVQTQNLHNMTLSGNTAGAMAQISSGTLTLAGGNNITLSQAGNAITISGGALVGGGAGTNTLGMSNLGNTSGTTGVITGTNLQFALAGGNNVTLSQSINGSSATITMSAANQTVQTQNMVSVNGSTGALTFANGNNITFGNNASTITASASFNQSVQSVGIVATGANTIGQSSSNTLDARSFNISGQGEVSVGMSGSTLQISSPVQSVQTQNMVSLGGSTGNIVVSNANNVTFGANASTITASASFSQSNQNVSLYALGNTTQNASTVLNASNLSFNGLGNVTVGYSNGSIQISATGGGGGGGGIALANSNATVTNGTAVLSVTGGALSISGNNSSFNFAAPATSSLSATGLVSISTNGGTISIGASVPNNSMDFYQNMDRGTSATLAVPYGSLMLQRLNQENDEFAANITANTFLVNMSANVTTSNSSANTISAYIGVYSDNTTALSLINSVSTSWGLTANTSNSALFNGPRWLSFVSSQWSAAPVFVQGAEYVLGMIFRSSSYAFPLSFIGQSYMASAQRSGSIGTSLVTHNSLAQGNYWNGVVGTSVMPSTIISSSLNRNNASANFIPHIILNNRYSGTF